MDALAGSYLAKLGLGVEPPTLAYLDRLVAAHQTRIAFETFTKMADNDQQDEYGSFLAPLRDRIERLCLHGVGGTCWTLASAFHWLLVELGYDAHLVYMDPGHLCTRVEIGGVPYYADVGYGAPLFRAYPMRESFTVSVPSETFEYRVTGDTVTVSRTPGPTKVLSMSPRRFEEFDAVIASANDWQASRFLQLLFAAKYVGGRLVKLTDGKLDDYRGDEPVTRELDDDGIAEVLATVFEIDPSLYFQARAIQNRRRSL